MLALKRALVLLAVCAGPLLSAPATLIVEEIVAKVNGDVILRSDYEQALAEIRGEIERDSRTPPEDKAGVLAEREKSTLRDLVDERLLVQKGKDLGMNVETQVLRQRDAIMKQYEIETVEEFERWASEKAGMPVEDLMDQMRDNFLSNSVLGQEVGSRIVVRRDEIEKYYKENPDEFVREEGVRLAEILIATDGAVTEQQRAEVEKKAREVHDRVQKGEPFAEMARRYSDSAGSKDNGGDIGIWRRGSLRADLEERVFDKNPGFMTDLIEAGNGYLIIKVVDKFREGLAGLDEVEEEIRNKLSGPRYAPAIREFLTELRYNAYIEIRPGYVDLGAAPGKDTSWSDPAKLAPVTTTRDEVLRKGKKKKLLWLVPLPGGGDKKSDADSASRVGDDI